MLGMAFLFLPFILRCGGRAYACTHNVGASPRQQRTQELNVITQQCALLELLRSGIFSLAPLTNVPLALGSAFIKRCRTCRGSEPADMVSPRLPSGGRGPGGNSSCCNHLRGFSQVKRIEHSQLHRTSVGTVAETLFLLECAAQFLRSRIQIKIER